LCISLRSHTLFSICIRNTIFSFTSCTFRICYHTSNILCPHNCWFNKVRKRLLLTCWLAFAVYRKIVHDLLSQYYSFYTWRHLPVYEASSSLIFLLLFAITLTHIDSWLSKFRISCQLSAAWVGPKGPSKAVSFLIFRNMFIWYGENRGATLWRVASVLADDVHISRLITPDPWVQGAHLMWSRILCFLHCISKHSYNCNSNYYCSIYFEYKTSNIKAVA
jgi:hypothetical protein